MLIHQAAALPYALDSAGRTRIMLITSRETRRWVLPKGNIDVGFTPHAAAAQEAWEEAGLTGVTCPVPVGAFKYVKRRRGVDRALTVAVYPFRVLDQAADWPERGERDTSWFDVEAAAGAVQEPDLSSLLRSFDGRPSATDCGAMVETSDRVRRRLSMPAWSRALMPRQGRFFE